MPPIKFPQTKTPSLASMLRVNYAGELAAVNMYMGQANALKGNQDLIMEMKSHEEKHLELFTKLMIKHRVRPSLLNPLWASLGYALGHVTATFGLKGAFLGTRAVEKVIVEHYNEELLKENDEELKPLIDSIRQCRDEEDSHREMASQGMDGNSIIDTVSEQIIQNGCKGAIEIAKKL